MINAKNRNSRTEAGKKGDGHRRLMNELMKGPPPNRELRDGATQSRPRFEARLGAE